jgi:TolB protein
MDRLCSLVVCLPAFLFLGHAELSSSRGQPSARPILFDSDRTGRQEIYELDPAASEAPRQLTDSVKLNGRSSFASRSPDGRRIAFILAVDGNADIAVMDADGSNLRRLTTNPMADQYPAWSRGSRRTAVSSCLPPIALTASRSTP